MSSSPRTAGSRPAATQASALRRRPPGTRSRGSWRGRNAAAPGQERRRLASKRLDLIDQLVARPAAEADAAVTHAELLHVAQQSGQLLPRGGVHADLDGRIASGCARPLVPAEQPAVTFDHQGGRVIRIGLQVLQAPFESPLAVTVDVYQRGRLVRGH